MIDFIVEKKREGGDSCQPSTHAQGGDSLLFFNEKSGALTFETGLRLAPNMTRKDLLAALKEAGGASRDLGESGIFPFPPCPVAGGSLAPVCFLQEDRLASVTLTVVSVGQKTALSAEQQRSFLFTSFRAKDPCPDTLRNCVLQCAFGAITLCTDPRSGRASARVSYS
jgi:hypothetical protein